MWDTLKFEKITIWLRPNFTLSSEIVHLDKKNITGEEKKVCEVR